MSSIATASSSQLAAKNVRRQEFSSPNDVDFSSLLSFKHTIGPVHFFVFSQVFLY